METIQWHRNGEKLCPLGKLNKQIAHEQTRDISALLIKTTLVCSSKIPCEKYIKYFQNLHNRFIIRWQPPLPTNKFLRFWQQNVNWRWHTYKHGTVKLFTFSFKIDAPWTLLAELLKFSAVHLKIQIW